MTESIHLNTVRDVQRPITLEKLTKKVDVEIEFSSEALENEDLAIALEDIDQEREQQTVTAKEYIPPLPAWRLFTIIFGYVIRTVHSPFDLQLHV
jgi:hypothetical protein